MAYVRFGYEGNSDFYIYEDIGGGYTTHVSSGEKFNHKTKIECLANVLYMMNAHELKCPSYPLAKLSDEILAEMGIDPCI